MVIFPHCKINIGLRIVRKREDGYHDLQSIFYPLPIYDVLEVIDEPSTNSLVNFKLTGLPIHGDTDNNLCAKAYQILKNDFPALPPITIHLHKNIPMGAGLGGGSADGSFALKLLNQKYGLGIDRESLVTYALQLGSDCPFFIEGKPLYAEGRGEIMESIPLDLSSYSFLLVSPGIHISTANAFKNINPAVPNNHLKDLIKKPMATWKNDIHNDFEESVFVAFPEIAQIKESLYRHGSLYASLTGSGSTVYGIFEKNNLPQGLFKGKYRVDQIF